MPNNNDNYEYMRFLDLTGVEQIWNTAKQTFVQTVNGVGIDANGNVNTSGANFPVGYVYITTDNSTSPASLFGGTWEQLKDRFLLGAGDTYSNGATGGEATHTLTTNEMPNHEHRVIVLPPNQSSQPAKTMDGAVASGSDYPFFSWGSNGNVYTDKTGGGLAHNNMPPYLVVYMWKRIA